MSRRAEHNQVNYIFPPNLKMADKLKENDGAFWKGMSLLVTFLLEKEYEQRALPRSSGGKSEVKLFDYIKNIRKGNTFIKFKPSKVKKLKIGGEMVRLDKQTSMEILEEVLYKLVPKEKDPRRLWRNCRKIRQRLKPHDIFMTPIPLAVKHICMVDYKRRDIWFDPFRGTGNYYKNFPVPIPQRRWCEINENKDFFQFDEKIDIAGVIKRLIPFIAAGVAAPVPSGSLA